MGPTTRGRFGIAVAVCAVMAIVVTVTASRGSPLFYSGGVTAVLLSILALRLVNDDDRHIDHRSVGTELRHLPGVLATVGRNAVRRPFDSDGVREAALVVFGLGGGLASLLGGIFRAQWTLVVLGIALVAMGVYDALKLVRIIGRS